MSALKRWLCAHQKCDDCGWIIRHPALWDRRAWDASTKPEALLEAYSLALYPLSLEDKTYQFIKDFLPVLGSMHWSEAGNLIWEALNSWRKSSPPRAITELADIDIAKLRERAPGDPAIDVGESLLRVTMATSIKLATTHLLEALKARGGNPCGLIREFVKFPWEDGCT